MDDDGIRQVMDRYGVPRKTEASEAMAMRGACAILAVPVDRGPDSTDSKGEVSDATEFTDTEGADAP